MTTLFNAIIAPHPTPLPGGEGTFGTNLRLSATPSLLVGGCSTQNHAEDVQHTRCLAMSAAVADLIHTEFR